MSNKEEFETGMHQDKTETSDEISVTEGTAEESENYDEEISDFEDDESGHDDEIEYIEEDMVYPPCCPSRSDGQHGGFPSVKKFLNIGFIKRQPGRTAIDHSTNAWTMGFAPGCDAE